VGIPCSTGFPCCCWWAPPPACACGIPAIPSCLPCTLMCGGVALSTTTTAVGDSCFRSRKSNNKYIPVDVQLELEEFTKELELEQQQQQQQQKQQQQLLQQ